MKRFLLVAALAAGCARDAAPRAAVADDVGSIGPTARARRDPTVTGARVVPVVAESDPAYGVEPGGGARALAGGVRLVVMPSGAIVASDDRLPDAPTVTTELPDRVGGGFLFVVGGVVWRADKWLARARPIVSTPSPVTQIIAGLDRVVLRLQTGAHVAIDARDGSRLELGPWPAAPIVTGYAAADGWRAAAIADLRGVVVTSDAGATWRALGVGIDASDVRTKGSAIVVRGTDASKRPLEIEVRTDGQIERLGSEDLGPTPRRRRDDHSAVARSPFGARPLAAAIEDGWPLDDGTAIVARDGALGRVRLSDGEIVSLAHDAFSLRPSRCHAVPFGDEPGAFGFVCGEPHGATLLARFDTTVGKLSAVRRFAAPRVVVASGNGVLVVGGRCSDSAAPDDRAHCVVTSDGSARDVLANEAGDRAIALRDGRVLFVTPPHGDVDAARLTVLDASGQRSIPLALASATGEAQRAIDLGVWLDGFEERKPGVVGGWIDLAGAMVGVEIAIDGHARFGPVIRDGGHPVASGRYGLGWTASRRAFETTDGGMSWLPIDVPAPLVARPATRACGPIGCSAAGWLRVGWGDPIAPAAQKPPPMLLPRPRTYASLPLACSVDAVETHAHARAPARARPQMPAFYNHPAPTAPEGSRTLTFETSDLVDRSARVGQVARLYAWGPTSTDWGTEGRWAVRWSWPFGGADDVRSSLVAPAPQLLADVARFGSGSMLLPYFTVAPGDDASHALLVARRTAQAEATLIELEDERAPLEIHRADGETFTTIDATLRMNGRWYVAAPSESGVGPSSPTPALAATVIWQIDGPLAHEIARIPRTALARRGARLARRFDGRMIGLVVDGEPDANHSSPSRWVAPIDLETGAVLDPEPLGVGEFDDRPFFATCGADAPGWVLDVPALVPISITLGSKPLGSLEAPLLRAHLTATTACVERASGALDGIDVASALSRATPPRPGATTIPVSVLSARSRYALRCARP